MHSASGLVEHLKSCVCACMCHAQAQARHRRMHRHGTGLVVGDGVGWLLDVVVRKDQKEEDKCYFWLVFPKSVQ